LIGTYKHFNELQADATGILPMIQFSGADSQAFNISFHALNGSWTELVRLRKINGKWLEAIKVTMEGKDKPVLVSTDKGYPTVNGEPDWK